MKKLSVILLLVVLMLALALPASAKDSAVGTTLRLSSMEGTVSVKNASGKAVTANADMRLYSGYTVSTSANSYAYISLDGTKVVKLDASSSVSISKSGKKLEVMLSSGNLFFNVTAPLASDESLNIRTSTMLTGIRGTSGEVIVTDFFYDFSACTEERHEAEKFTRYILPENYYVIYGKSLRAFVDVYDNGMIVDSFGNKAYIDAKDALAFNQSKDKTKLNLRSTELRLFSGSVTVSDPNNPNGRKTVIRAGERTVLGNFRCDTLTVQGVQKGPTILPPEVFRAGEVRGISLEEIAANPAALERIREESPELAEEIEELIEFTPEKKAAEQKAAAENNQIKDAEAGKLPGAGGNKPGSSVIPVFETPAAVVHTHAWDNGTITTQATATTTGVITYTCPDCGETFSEAYSLKMLGNIAITTPADKTSYVEGEPFDPTGMVVTATYQDNTFEEVDNWTWAYPTAQQTYLANGDNAITVSYTGDIQVNTEQPVTVRQPVVTFDMGGNTTATAINPMTVAYGSGLQIADATSASSTFGGWYKDAQLTTPWVIGTDTVTGDMTLYAKWSLKNYTVSFNNDALVTDPSTMPGNQTVNYGEKVAEPAAPTSTDYNFTGWEFDDGQQTALWDFNTALSDAYVQDGMLDLFASWELKTYTVRFNNDNANVTGLASMPATQTVNYGNAVTVQGSPTSTNYNFLGWEVRNGQTATDWTLSTTLNDGNTTGGYLDLYAKWAIKQYKVTFGENTLEQGIVNITGLPDAPVVVDYGSKIPRPTATPTSDSHIFVSWGNIDSEVFYEWNFDTVLGPDPTLFNPPEDGYDGTLTLYPSWEVKRFTLTFDANGVEATVPDAISNVAYGTSFADLQNAYQEQNDGGYLAEPTQAGTYFDAWYTTDACDVEALPQNDPANAVKITEDTTLYAGWFFEVNFNLSMDKYLGLEVDLMNPVQVRANTNVAEPNLTIDGSESYLLDGWYTDPNYAEGTQWYFDDNPVTAPMTLYAKWLQVNRLTIFTSDTYQVETGTSSIREFYITPADQAYTAYVPLGESIDFTVLVPSAGDPEPVFNPYKEGEAIGATITANPPMPGNTVDIEGINYTIYTFTYDTPNQYYESGITLEYDNLNI